MKPLRRPPAAAGVHRLVQQPAQLAMLGVRRHHAGLGALEAQHPDEHRRHRDVGEHVDGLRMAVDAVEELRIGDPVPGKPASHRLVGDRLDPGHGEHRPIPHLRTHRGEPEPAVSDHHRRDAVPAGQRQVRIPEELRVVVRVQVDEAGRDDHPAGVEHPVGVGGAQPCRSSRCVPRGCRRPRDSVASACRRRRCRPSGWCRTQPRTFRLPPALAGMQRDRVGRHG